jgi:hypothetical protein
MGPEFYFMDLPVVVFWNSPAAFPSASSKSAASMKRYSSYVHVPHCQKHDGAAYQAQCMSLFPPGTTDMRTEWEVSSRT